MEQIAAALMQARWRGCGARKRGAAATTLARRWRGYSSQRFALLQKQMRHMSTCCVCMQEHALQNTRCVCGAVTCRACTIAMTNSTTCPVCRQQRTLTPQDAALRKIMVETRLKLECGHCGAFVHALRHEHHVQWCARRVHECPLRGCPYRGVACELHAHLARDHSTPVLRLANGYYGTTVLMTPAVQSFVLCLANGYIVTVESASRNLLSVLQSPGAPMWLRVGTIRPRPSPQASVAFAIEQYDARDRLTDSHVLEGGVDDFSCVPRCRGEAAMQHGGHAPDATARSRAQLVESNNIQDGGSMVPVAVLTFKISVS